MSVVSRQLEMTTRRTIRGTLNGKIPRMLLIQVSCRVSVNVADVCSYLRVLGLYVCGEGKRRMSSVFVSCMDCESTFATQ